MSAYDEMFGLLMDLSSRRWLLPEVGMRVCIDSATPPKANVCRGGQWCEDLSILEGFP